MNRTDEVRVLALLASALSYVGVPLRTTDAIVERARAFEDYITEERRKDGKNEDL